MDKCYYKDRYYRLKALNICTSCGKTPARPGRTDCEKCAERSAMHYKDERIRQEAALRAKKQKLKHTLEEVSRMAVERGISYGQMVAILEKEERNGTKK